MKRLGEKEAGERRNMSRREVLGLVAATTAASLFGCTGERFASGEQKTTSQTVSTSIPGCVVRPEQTEGPYFVEERLNRSDIRSDPSDKSMKDGLPLRVVFNVRRVAGGSCTPLAGAIVDLWQCDAQGVYSDFHDFNGLFDTRGKKFLRGYQETDANGKAQFLTIYPGWYPGRTVHVHFKIRTGSSSERGHEFTSQLYFDDSLTDQVHAQPPYASRGQRTLRNERDGIFGSGGRELMLQLTKDGQGYLGTFDIGLQLT